jgi:CheY-like chemotaxis protein
VALHALVVDDDEIGRRLAQRVLEGQGFDVTCVDGAVAALAAIEVRRPDVVVLDVVMPGMTGTELLEQIKSNPRLASIPVVMVTSRTSDADLLASYQSGADYYITKPLVADELLYGVSLLLGHHAPKPVPPVPTPIQTRAPRRG